MTSNSAKNPEAKLLKTTTIYMIGDLLTRFMQILILPIITVLVATEDYGYYDLVITVKSLILPIITMQSIDAVFRFLFDAKDEKKSEVITNVLFLITVGIIISFLISYIINIEFYKIRCYGLIVLSFISTIYYKFLQKVARSQRKSRVYAISGVIQTATILISQIVLIKYIGMRVEGLLMSYFLSNFVSVLYLGSKTRIYKEINIRQINKEVIKQVIKFSAPLIPNSISWWFVSAANRFVISISLGSSANGLFAIANKFPGLLSIATGVFQLAWQESAITQYGKSNQTEYYSKIFEVYFKILASGYIVLIPLIKIVFPLLIAEKYIESWKFIPLLMLSAIFAAIASFYGSGYISSKKTKGAFTTTTVSALINCTISISLIKLIGLYAAGLGTAVAYLSLWIIRHVEMKEYFKIHINKWVIMKFLIFFIICTVVYYLDNLYTQIFMVAISSIFVIVENRMLLIGIIKKITVKIGV